MKIRNTFMALFMLLSLAAIGQTSAYQCLPSENPISPNMTFTPSAYIQSCIEFGGNQYLYQQGDIHLEAVNYIQIEPGFQAGLMDPDGSMLMQLAQQPAGYDVFLMSGLSMVGLPRYKKVEFGVQLEGALHNRIEAFVHPSSSNTATPLNPYLESKLDVQMIFTHESGLQRKVDAFYYQDFFQNTTTNDWDELLTEHPMRLRFAPHLNGKWSVRPTVKVEGVVVAYLLPFSFEVVESGHPGFVKVHQNKRNLERNNRIIFPLGHNFPSPYAGVDLWINDPNETNKAARVDDWNEYHERVRDFAIKGGKYIRTLQAAWSSLIEFEHLGNYTNRLHYAWEQDHLIETCEEYDLLMQFNLMQQEPIMKFANFDFNRWDFGHWKQDGSIDSADPYPAYCYYTYNGKEPREMYTNSDDLTYHKQRTRYYLSRYGYSPQIYAFELVNEPFHLGEISPSQTTLVSEAILDGATLDAIEYYHTTIASYIKNDLGHVNQLIGVGQANLLLKYPSSEELNSPSWWSGLSDSLDLSALNPSIDYVFFSEYADAPDKLLISKPGNNRLKVDNGENSHYARISWLHELFSKPVMYSESGHVGENQICSQYVGHYKDVMSFGFTGVAGFNMWAGFNGDYGGEENQLHLHESTIRAERHMNGNDVIYTLIGDANNSGQWQQGREKEDHGSTPDLKEHQYYVSSDKLKAVGYIYNRTHNRFTNQNPPDCTVAIPPNTNGDFNTWVTPEWNNKKMKIQGLSNNEWYTIDLYTYKDGIFWDTKCVKSNATGRLTLEHEPMDPNVNPVLWYVIKRNNCNGKRSMEEAEGSSELTIDQSLSLSIYPNPNSGILNLQIGAEEGQPVSLRIFNMHGQEVYTNGEAIERQLTLETGLKPGIYLIKITDGQNEQTKKFIVQ